MAHECSICGSDCYCNGDIDDCVVSLTPKNCKSCGCADEDWHEDQDDDEDVPEYYQCLGCGWTGDVDPGHCPRCAGYCVEGVY